MFGRTIFAKLFVSFAMTVLVVGIVTVLITFSFSHRSLQGVKDSFQKQRNSTIAQTIIAMGKAAYIVYEYQGCKELVSYIKDTNDSMATRLFLIIDGQTYPLGQNLPPTLKEITVSSSRNGRLQLVEIDKQLLVAKPLLSEDGKQYMIAGVHKLLGGPPPPWEKIREKRIFPKPLFPPPLFPGFYILINTSVFLFISGLVCFWLARSFSNPINRLRSASRQIASGNLSARVETITGTVGSELTYLALDFNNMAERLEKLVQYQKRLLIDISHELRSPLARVAVALELARKGNKEQNDKMLNKMEKELGRLNELIGQLLVLPISEQKQENLDKDYFDLAALVKEAVNDVSFEVESTGKHVEIVDCLKETYFKGSKELIRQAVENIIRNGAYYTAEGTRVDVSLTVQKSSDNSFQEAIILVKDCGPGIPQEELVLVFEPFYRVSSARERLKNGSGVGIGLSIANQAVHQHGGRIVLKNAVEGTGLLARIVLPLR